MDSPARESRSKAAPEPAPPPPPAGPRKLYKIGEVMHYTKLSRQTLHNYTMMGLIQASERTESGHRLYDESVFPILKRIEMLKAHRTLSEVKELLANEGNGS